MGNKQQVVKDKAETQSVRILVFGIGRDIVGGKSAQIGISLPCKSSDLRKAILDTYPAFLELQSLRIAVDREYVHEDRIIQGHEEIALIPPVSGG